MDSSNTHKITRPNVLYINVGSVVPETYKRDVNYKSPLFRTTNGQTWYCNLAIRQNSTALSCYLFCDQPVLYSGKIVKYWLNQIEFEYAFTLSTGFGSGGLIPLNDGKFRDEIIRVEINVDDAFEALLNRYSHLINNEALSDVSFQVAKEEAEEEEVEWQTIYAISHILADKSPYFKCLLTTPHFSESNFDKTTPIRLKGLTSLSVLRCFEWMYVGCILNDHPMTITDAIDLYNAADLFQIKDLLDRLPDYLDAECQPTFQDFGSVFVFAHQRGLVPLLKKVIRVWLEEALAVDQDALIKSKREASGLLDGRGLFVNVTNEEDANGDGGAVDGSDSSDDAEEEQFGVGDSDPKDALLDETTEKEKIRKEDQGKPLVVAEQIEVILDYVKTLPVHEFIGISKLLVCRD
ncbi:hypothetical protein HDV05_008056 [Chytridiales sp. JEL 0842]|nr:hypothetical protein HDV05_008056 [Chytridiales sp. JEL 0842]